MPAMARSPACSALGAADVARELITLPSVTAAFLGYMRDSMAAQGESIPVDTQVPNPRPPRFLRCLNSGGARLSTGHGETLMLVECWGRSESDADRLATVAYAVAQAAELSSGAYVPEGERGTIATPYPLPDLDTGAPRTLFTVRLIIPAETL